MTDTEFINKINAEIEKYNDASPFDTLDTNCATWVNTMLKNSGISETDRINLGEFWGVDWGEEDLIPSTYFIAE